MPERQKLTVPLSSEELEDLMDGKEFHWAFMTNKGEWIDVTVVQKEEEEEFEEEE